MLSDKRNMLHAKINREKRYEIGWIFGLFGLKEIQVKLERKQILWAYLI